MLLKKELERFMNKVNKRESGCWEWTANKSRKGNLS